MAAKRNLSVAFERYAKWEEGGVVIAVFVTELLLKVIGSSRTGN